MLSSDLGQGVPGSLQPLTQGLVVGAHGGGLRSHSLRGRLVLIARLNAACPPLRFLGGDRALLPETVALGLGHVDGANHGDAEALPVGVGEPDPLGELVCRPSSAHPYRVGGELHHPFIGEPGGKFSPCGRRLGGHVADGIGDRVQQDRKQGAAMLVIVKHAPPVAIDQLKLVGEPARLREAPRAPIALVPCGGVVCKGHVAVDRAALDRSTLARRDSSQGSRPMVGTACVVSALDAIFAATPCATVGKNPFAANGTVHRRVRS
jgi:hypothetical protein